MCFRLREWEVKKSQAGDGGLHAVGQSSGTAVPREPRTQVAEELHAGIKTVTILEMQHVTAVHNKQFCDFKSATSQLHGSTYCPCCSVTTFQSPEEKEEFYICKSCQKCLKYSGSPYLQGQPGQREKTMTA